MPSILLFILLILSCTSSDNDIDINDQAKIENQIFENNIPANIVVKTMPKGQHGFYKVENRCVPWNEAEKNDFDSNFQNHIKDWVSELN